MKHVGGRAHEEAHERIEDDEGEAGEKAELRIRQAELRNDEVCEALQELAIDEVHYVEKRQERKETVVPQGDRLVLPLPGRRSD